MISRVHLGVRSTLFWDFTQRRNLVMNIAGQLVGPVFNGQAIQEYCLTVA